MPLLHKLLRSSEQLMTDFVQKYFNQALDSFLDSQAQHGTGDAFGDGIARRHPHAGGLDQADVEPAAKQSVGSRGGTERNRFGQWRGRRAGNRPAAPRRGRQFARLPCSNFRKKWPVCRRAAKPPVPAAGPSLNAVA